MILVEEMSSRGMLAYFSSYSHKNVVIMFNPVQQQSGTKLSMQMMMKIHFFSLWYEKNFAVIALKLHFFSHPRGRKYNSMFHYENSIHLVFWQVIFFSQWIFNCFYYRQKESMKNVCLRGIFWHLKNYFYVSIFYFLIKINNLLL